VNVNDDGKLLWVGMDRLWWMEWWGYNVLNCECNLVKLKNGLGLRVVKVV
jgi:hypothetical protein